VVRTHYDGPVVCEPRHPSWFAARPHGVLQRYAVARVIADPPITDGANAPGGWDGIAYFRLHGAPRMYWSRYDASYLSRLAMLIRRVSESVDVWCVFDNTASGAALDNAWELQRVFGQDSESAQPCGIGSTNCPGGRFNESADIGKSLATDRRTKAKAE
jgi:uncharacterized protein YecE (DUF72 family)